MALITLPFVDMIKGLETDFRWRGVLLALIGFFSESEQIELSKELSQQLVFSGFLLSWNRLKCLGILLLRSG